MASSFHIFRKHEKVLIAIAACVAMFVFVLADPLMSWLRRSTNGGQGSPSATVVTWDGGSLTGRELESLHQRRYFISNFLRELYMEGARAIESEGGTPTDPTVPSFVLSQERSDPREIMRSTVTTRIIAELAADEGMSVSDEMINHYLREFGLRKVSDVEIGQILKKTSPADVGHSEKQLFAGIRELLLQNYYMSSYGSVIQNIMPEQRWDDWQQINRRIALEAAVVPTDKFLAEVPEPTEADLLQLYDQFKDQIGNRQEMLAGVQLTSPDPGFREPRRVRLQFLLADVNQWTEKLLDSITDQEISDYYERNKRTQFVKVDLFSDESTPEENEPAEESEAEEAAEDSKNTEESTPEDNPAEEETAEEPESPKPDSPESESPESKSPESSSEDSTPAPSEDESSSSFRTSPFRLASLQDESAAEEAPAEQENSAAEQPVETESAKETAEKSDPPETASEDTSAEQSEDTNLEADNDEKPVEYESLETVSDEIRRRLANDKAVVELDRIMGRIYTKLQSKYNRYGGELILAKSKELEPPAPPAELADLSGAATELGLIHEETALLSYPELLDTALGKATDAQTRRIPIAYAAFIKSQMEMYEPFLAQDLDGHWYLAVKIEDLESRVPPLEEVRDRVASAWKTRESAKRALTRAEELAKEAEESGETLIGFFADKNFEVVTTDLFSRLTFGTTPMEMQRGARLGEAPPLESIDRNFMDEAFDLKTDQVAAILNHDQTKAYVIRLDRREKTEDELHQLFLLEVNDWYGDRAMRSMRLQNAAQILVSQLTKQVGLDRTKLEEYLAPKDDR